VAAIESVKSSQRSRHYRKRRCSSDTLRDCRAQMQGFQFQVDGLRQALDLADPMQTKSENLKAALSRPSHLWRDLDKACSMPQ